MKELAEESWKEKNYQIAFNSFLQINEVDKCIDVLKESGQIAEACLFARTYKPLRLADLMEDWNSKLNDFYLNNRVSKFLYL